MASSDSGYRRARAPVRVALVNMPFALADRPSIQCGLLKSSLAEHGYEVDVHYLNVELAAALGAKFYRTVSLLRVDQFLGEWLFSAAAFGYCANEEAYLAACPSLASTCRTLGVTFGELCEQRKEHLPRWLAGWAERVDWGRYAAVGFSSTFEQNCAALALARLIKRKHAHVAIVFGGANYDDQMGKEYLRSLDYIDYIVAGEGDVVLPDLLDRIAGGRSAADVEGVSGRECGQVYFSDRVAAGPPSLDRLPDPNYDEYFETLFRLGTERVLGDAAPLLLFESARGCWWGQKHHCTFCGLNANRMTFRSRSADAVLAQLRRLSARYKITNFEAVDNIMDMAYLEELCLPLAQQHHDYRLFYEVKGNLKPAQLKLMARAGINSIQPGIESLSTRILGLMRKGITMPKNLRLLKWAYYYGMRVTWNLLIGFPGETSGDYERQIGLLPTLYHLPPPVACSPIWLERFSPYFFDRSFPVRNVRPNAAYRFVYPGAQLDLSKIAYFFEHDVDVALPRSEHRALASGVEAWKTRWEQSNIPTLIYQRAPDWMQMVDSRGSQAVAHAFEGGRAEIYEFCGETDRTVDGIHAHLAAAGPCDCGIHDRVGAVLADFCDKGLMVEDDGRFFSLALPANAHW